MTDDTNIETPEEPTPSDGSPPAPPEPEVPAEPPVEPEAPAPPAPEVAPEPAEAPEAPAPPPVAPSAPLPEPTAPAPTYAPAPPPPPAPPAPAAYPGQQYAPPQPQVPPCPKSKVAAGVLGILLGQFGVHKFYLGYTTEGLIMLAVTLVSFGVLSWIPWIVGIIEGIMYLTMDDQQFCNTYVYNKKGWF